MWDLPVPGGPIRARFSLAGIHSSDVRYAHVGAGMEEAATSNCSTVLMTGNVAALSLAAAPTRPATKQRRESAYGLGGEPGGKG